MFIIFDPTSVENRAETPLEVNIDAYDMCVIRKIQGEKFKLALKKFYDGYFSDKSAIWFDIATLDTYEKCLELYQAIRQARQFGAVEFDVGAYMSKHFPVENRLKADNIPTV